VTKAPKALPAFLRVRARAFCSSCRPLPPALGQQPTSQPGWSCGDSSPARSRPAPPPRPAQILEQQGNKIISPADRKSLHPLIIPLAEGPVTTSDDPDASVNGSSTVIGLLRWPQPLQYKVRRPSCAGPAASVQARIRPAGGWAAEQARPPPPLRALA
jgi:hypothetical protein